MTNTINNTSFTILALLLLGLFAVVLPAPAAASHVDPIFVPGNPSCTDLGYDFGFKPQPEPPPSGTYTFPDGFHTVTITSDGTFFDWSSTLGIDAVIVKGGPNANLYGYDPESFGDSGLHSPINPNNNTPFAISHIEFCYDYEVDVSKDAETSFTRTYEWDITKDVDPDEFWLFAGDSDAAGYTVAVEKTGFTDSDWTVAGTITIENNTPFDATIESVSDEISGYGSVSVNCGVSFPHILPAGQALECTYSTPLPDGSDRTNTATVETSGIVGGGEDTANVIFGDPTTEVNAEINVTDDYGTDADTSDDLHWGPFGDSADIPYNRTFECSNDPADYTNGHYAYTVQNLATIDETGQHDDASVTVHCYAPLVSKDAHTSFTRTYEWTIEKSADQNQLTLSPGQLFPVNYSVTVDATYADSDWAVEGTITVANPNPKADMTVSLADVVSGGIAANLDCGGSLVVPAGGSATCGYSADLPDGSNRTNTATATLNGIDFSYDKPFDFTNATITEEDECIDVSDTNVGFLGTVCTDQAPQTFNYSLWFGNDSRADVYLECGDNTHTNVASFVTNDTAATGEDSWTVNAYVACGFGCTLTPGYWKTHSGYGPAPYDDTWALIGEDTPFFLSGQSYYDVLWTAPRGNAYYILAHAYIAAELNVLNGAYIPTDVLDAWDEATNLFAAYSPHAVAEMKGKAGKDLRAQFIYLAEILDDYNNGITGPGHCSE